MDNGCTNVNLLTPISLKHVVGNGAHSYVYGGHILPDTLRWIWAADPAPAAAALPAKL